jgi:hypothetical protein
MYILISILIFLFGPFLIFIRELRRKRINQIDPWAWKLPGFGAPVDSTDDGKKGRASGLNVGLLKK